MSSSTYSRVLKVGILGFGTVGSGVYRMLDNNREAISHRIGTRIEIVAIGVKDANKPRTISSDLLTTDLDSIVEDPTIDVVLELIGGTDPAARLVQKALASGKSVVTANKELMAKQGSALVQLASSNRLDMHYEAAVGGGIPLIQPLKHQLAGNDVLKMMGILNGTTNYILTKMANEKLPLEQVLKEAQDLGYAEADPTNDVDGFDTSYKLAVLGSIAFGNQVPIDGVYREGIRGIQPDEMQYADLLGFRIKLLGIVEPVGDAVLARVHPTLLPKKHPLASVDDVYNALWIHGDFVGDLMFSGRGAGGDPTASAVVGDLIDVARNLAAKGPGSAIPYGTGIKTVSIDELQSAYYVRVTVDDQPKVLGNIASAFGNHEVSLAAMEMRVKDKVGRKGEIVFLTHICREGSFKKALSELKEQQLVEKIEAWMRVEES